MTTNIIFKNMMTASCQRKLIGILALHSIFLALLSIAFSNTDGLLVVGYAWEGEITYARELLSSGNDDDLCIEVGKVFFSLSTLIILIGLVRGRIGWLAISVLSLLYLFQVVALVLIEVGSIWDTIFWGRNYVLGFWVVLFLSYALLMGVYTRWKFSNSANPSIK